MQGKVTELHHVQLAMPAGGEEKAVLFYQDLLGIPRVSKPESRAKAGGAWFEACPLRVHLGVDPAFTPAKKAHPGLVVINLSALAERLTAANFQVTWDDGMEGFKRVYVVDPFGNRLELMEPIK
jgi:catechol 2,3-dioxygenase-like lactoylglutathione lyase family enzyme